MSVGEIFYILFSDESHPSSSVRDGFNMDEENPIECTYMFPMDPKHLLTSFKAVIGDTVINTKVVDK